MSSLNAKCRTNFAEWLDNIADDILEDFVFGGNITGDEFGSNDFILHNAGASKGEPVNCHMIEARISGRTKDKQLKRLLQNSRSVGTDPARLAFVLIPKSMDGYCMGQHVRQALQESPVEGESRVNKIHVQWSPSVKLRDGKPRFDTGIMPFVFEKIAFAGFNVDGTKVEKKDKEKKK